MLRLALAVATVLALAGAAQAATGLNVRTANQLKPAIQRYYKAQGSDDVFTKVTCIVTAAKTGAHCKAYFTSMSANEKGWFDVTVAMTSGHVGRWQATKVTCISPKTGAKIAC